MQAISGACRNPTAIAKEVGIGRATVYRIIVSQSVPRDTEAQGCDVHIVPRYYLISVIFRRNLRPLEYGRSMLLPVSSF